MANVAGAVSRATRDHRPRPEGDSCADFHACRNCSQEPVGPGANLTYCDMHHWVLEGVDLTGANLVRANLTTSWLWEAKLIGADLHSAKLTNAVLRHADLTRADLRGADLTDAELAVSVTTFPGVKLCRTKMPDGSINNRDCPR